MSRLLRHRSLPLQLYFSLLQWRNLNHFIRSPCFETFAKKLGVSVEKNSISIIKVLKNLVLMKSTDTAKYIKWLVMLQDLMDENFKCDKGNVA